MPCRLKAARMMHKDSAQCRKSHALRHLHSTQAVHWPTYARTMRMQKDCPSDGDRWVLAIYTFSPASLGIHWHTAVVTMEWTLDYSFFVFLKSWMAHKEAKAVARPHSQHDLTTWAKWPNGSSIRGNRNFRNLEERKWHDFRLGRFSGMQCF